MSMLDFANANIPSPEGVTDTIHDDGNTWDIITVILNSDNRLENYMCQFARAFTPDYAGLNALWNFTHKYIKYVADQPGLEVVKDPRVTWKHRSGDCKSFSLFIASVLKCLGIPYRYRFAAYSPGDPTHVYVIAKLNNQDVILDATIDRFDREVSYHKKWDKVTKIVQMRGPSKVHSIKTQSAKPSIKERIADAPRVSIEKSFIDYSNMTEGELTLRLLDEQAKILTAYYGDPDGDYQRVRNYIYTSSKNLHSLTGHIGYVDPKFYNLFSYIEYAKERSKPAGIASARIGDFKTDREALLKDCDYTRSEYLKWQTGGRVDPLTKKRTPDYNPRKKDGSPWNPNDLSKAKLACDDQVFFLDLFNQHLEGTSPHLLYEFIPADEINFIPNTASFKANNHRLANSAMSRYSQLDRTNIVLWERNGIMRASAAKGIPDISPEGFINEWKTLKVNGIGNPAILIPIITAAIGFASKLLELILTKKAAFAADLTGFGSPPFGPEENDFNNNGIPDGKEPPKPEFDFNSILPFAALGLGAVLLLNGKK